MNTSFMNRPDIITGVGCGDSNIVSDRFVSEFFAFFRVKPVLGSKATEIASMASRTGIKREVPNISPTEIMMKQT